MKIGNNSRLIVISLTDREAAWLGHRRADIEFNPMSAHEFVKITGAAQGRYSLTRNADRGHPQRFDVSVARPDGLPLFRSEEVGSRTPASGLLFGVKPKMDIAPIQRLGSHVRKPSLTTMPGIDELRQAVQCVNNFKATYGDDINLTIEDGQLRMRMMLEL